MKKSVFNGQYFDEKNSLPPPPPHRFEARVEATIITKLKKKNYSKRGGDKLRLSSREGGVG